MQAYGERPEASFDAATLRRRDEALHAPAIAAAATVRAEKLEAALAHALEELTRERRDRELETLAAQTVQAVLEVRLAVLERQLFEPTSLRHRIAHVQGAVRRATRRRDAPAAG